jgi:hypothetical protein
MPFDDGDRRDPHGGVGRATERLLTSRPPIRRRTIPITPIEGMTSMQASPAERDLTRFG